MLQRRIFYFGILLIFSRVASYGQVNLQTGSAVFSLPMFNWQDDKSRLTSTVALSYNSGNGLKVNDVASNVGQGWNLIAGGVITRMQLGEPDDQPAFAGTGIPTITVFGGVKIPVGGPDQVLNRYPAGWLYGNVPIANGCPNALTTYPIYGTKNNLYSQHNSSGQDKQLDYFSFQFNGKTGMFILDTAGGDHGVPIGDTKLKISFQRDPTMTSQGIRTTITSFTITDVDGLIYKFTLHGTTKILRVHFSDKTGKNVRATPKIGDLNPYYQSAFDEGPIGTSGWTNTVLAYPYIIDNWYLSEIDDPFTTRKITFAYHQLNLSVPAGQTISYNKSSDGNRYTIVSYRKSIISTQELNTIAYPDGHLVTINYSTTPRLDYVGQSAIANIAISYSGRYISEYQLNTCYFFQNHMGTPTIASEKQSARLCLRSLKKIGVDLKEDTPPYTFDYYIGVSNSDDIVPPPFFYAKDVWGYYNGSNSVTADNPQQAVDLTQTSVTPLNYYALKGLCFLNSTDVVNTNNAKAGYAQNGLLKSITYPTGGNLSYVYSQNTGTVIGSSTVQNLGGVHVSQTSSYDNYSAACNTPVVTQYNYVVNGTGSASSLWGFEAPVTSAQTSNSWEEHKKVTGLTGCHWAWLYPGILTQYEALSLDDLQKIMVALSPVLNILSTVSTLNDIIVAFSEGTFMDWLAVGLDVLAIVINFALTCFNQKQSYVSTNTYYDFDLNQASPLPAQFKRVEITESSGSIGKTVQQFTHGDASDPAGADYPLWYLNPGTGLPLPNTAIDAKQRFAPWAYGLPKLTTVYDISGNKIKETENDYDFTYAQEEIDDPSTCCAQNYWAIQSCKCQVINNFSVRGDVWVNPTWYDAANTYVLAPGNVNMNVDIYKMYTGRALLSKSYERTYRVTDATQYVQTETEYVYNNGFPCVADGGCSIFYHNYDVSAIFTHQSNGDVISKLIYYPGDYNKGILATLVQKNILSTPIATLNYVNKSGTSTEYLNEKITEFTQLSNGDVKPLRILEQRFIAPTFTIAQYSGPTTTNYSIYRIPEQFTYDVNGNLTGVKDEGNRVVTNIYDLNDKYIVASIINADPSTDKTAYTSFESGDLSRSNWTLTGTSNYGTTSGAPTGSHIFTLLSSGSNSLTVTMSTSTKQYTLSYWASDPNVGVYVNGSTTAQTPIKSAPTYGGYTYYEYLLSTGITSVVVKNKGGVNDFIDELRFYPSTARMRTTTYDPLIGKTSECDENNRITYYTYDNLGRMQLVEDESRNVVKMYEYNNISPGKAIACPTTFFSRLVSEVFTRSNCDSAHQGTSVTYTIPANQFSSATSQFDADIQAEISTLINGQNYANTNGSCALIYYNTAHSQTDTTSICPAGYKGGLVTYTVPAKTYSSISSQADADQQALDDITANALTYADDSAHAVCILDTAQDWEWAAADSTTSPADPSYCLSVNGQLPPHQFLIFTDQNPNSPTYNQTRTIDNGPNSACPANTYFSNTESGTFTRNNCPAGYTPGSAVYVVPPGKYSSTVSQAAADLQSTNDVAANGQNYANINGTCSQSCNFAPATNWSVVAGSLFSSGGSTSFYIAFRYVPGNPSWSTNNTVATITGGCLPSANRVLTMSASGASWQITITTTGLFEVKWLSGTLPPGNATIGFTGGSYPL